MTRSGAADEGDGFNRRSGRARCPTERRWLGIDPSNRGRHGKGAGSGSGPSRSPESLPGSRHGWVELHDVTLAERTKFIGDFDQGDIQGDTHPEDGWKPQHFRSAATQEVRTMQTNEEVEFIGIPEWRRRIGCSRDSGYRAAGWNDISGVFYSPFAIRGEGHRLRQAVPNSIPHA